jgi:hypothetical protein
LGQSKLRATHYADNDVVRHQIMNNHITLKQFKESFDSYKNSVSEIAKEDLKFLWFDNYYDGMLYGMLEYEAKKYRFEIISDYTENTRPRVFAVIFMAEKQIDEETYWNKLFQKYVGNHCNLDSNEELRQEAQNLHHLFYDEYKRRDDPGYDSNIVKAWFIEKQKAQCQVVAAHNFVE